MSFLKGPLLFLWEIFKTVVLVAAIVVPIRWFVFQPFIVRGQSMEPNFHNGDYLIIDEISYRLTDPKRGEIIIFKYPNDPSQRYIKRIIGLPGEVVEITNGQVAVETERGQRYVLEEDYLPAESRTAGGVMLSLGQDEYFVLGDNRPFSSDSRSWGSLSREEVMGKVILRMWPLAAFAKFELPEYPTNYE